MPLPTKSKPAVLLVDVVLPLIPTPTVVVLVKRATLFDVGTLVGDQFVAVNQAPLLVAQVFVVCAFACGARSVIKIANAMSNRSKRMSGVFVFMG